MGANLEQRRQCFDVQRHQSRPLIGLEVDAVCSSGDIPSFFSRKPFSFDRRGKRLIYDPVRFPDGKEWLYRPLMEKLCQYESYKNGTLNLIDILIMNELLDVQAENDARADIARKNQQGR